VVEGSGSGGARGQTQNRRSIIATVPAHGDLGPRARIYSLCSWSIQLYYECKMAGAMSVNKSETEFPFTLSLLVRVPLRR
jgi:hypothetical protein